MSFRRRARRFLVLLALAAVVALFLFAGVIIDHVDAVAPADVIYVLGGSRVMRAVEAADLYHEHEAPKILVSQAGREPLEIQLGERGIHVPTEGEIGRDMVVAHFDVPAGAIELLPNPVDNTAEEASVVVGRARAEHWSRLIVITDCSSTRRAGFVFRRALGPTVDVVARCSRYDAFNPWLWWRTRPTFRQTFYELPKLIAYWLGLRA